MEVGLILYKKINRLISDEINLKNFKIDDILLDQTQINLFLQYFFSWILFYLFIHFLPFNCESKKKTLDTKNRIVSIFHATIVFILGLYDYLFEESKCGELNSNFQTKILIFSCSYFLYDMIACVILGISDFNMIFHHIIVVISEYSGVLYSLSGREMISAIISAEISNPIMHLRTILDNFGLKHTKLYLLLESYYFLSYTLARLLFGTYVTYYLCLCETNLLIVQISGVLIILQSVKYSYNMISITKKRFRELNERKNAGVSLYWLSTNEEVKKLDYYIKSQKEKYVP